MMKISFIVALIFATCAFAPPEGSERWTPPPMYRAQWDSAQACTGKAGVPFDRLVFYIVPGHDFPCHSGRCIGEWNPGHRIAIAEDFKNTGWVVRHEMIHDLVGSHFEGDTVIWGVACRATWGWLAKDSTYKP